MLQNATPADEERPATARVVKKQRTQITIETRKQTGSNQQQSQPLFRRGTP